MVLQKRIVTHTSAVSCDKTIKVHTFVLKLLDAGKNRDQLCLA